MRIERWFWLPIFCIVSILMHLTVAVTTRGAGANNRPIEPPNIEVAFEPAVQPQPKPVAKPTPPKPKPRPSVVRGPRPAVVTPFRVASIRRVPTIERPNVPAVRPVIGVNPLPITVKPKPTAADLPERIKSEAPDSSRVEAVAAPARINVRRPDPRAVEGGGSPSPAPIPGGHGGLNAPEAPKEDVLYTGGGRGGAGLPAVPPKIGGGGGKSILSVRGENPLGDGIPDDKPGIGPGIGGGLGTGAKGGVGSGAGKGIGTLADGRVTIGSLRRKPGSGIGAAIAGSAIGTRPPGGGHGRGAELPGTGGTGNGYGRGHGTRIGDGADDSVPPARLRGVPFGNVAGLLAGGDNGGGSGGPGRGAPFVARQAGGGGGPIHIVYALDISGSMKDGNKIGKAKEALKVALTSLRRSDTFNIIVFKKDASTFREDSVPATLPNIANAQAFVDQIQLGDGTNISGAMELAFDMNGITEVYLMSDGEPNGGIADFGELRRFILSKNKKRIKITTLALGLGEDFPGIRLLNGIAEDNNGTFRYVNLGKRR